MSKAFQCDFCKVFFKSKGKEPNAIGFTYVNDDSRISKHFEMPEIIQKQSMGENDGVYVFSICRNCYDKIEKMIKEV